MRYPVVKLLLLLALSNFGWAQFDLGSVVGNGKGSVRPARGWGYGRTSQPDN